VPGFGGQKFKSTVPEIPLTVIGTKVVGGLSIIADPPGTSVPPFVRNVAKGTAFRLEGGSAFANGMATPSTRIVFPRIPAGAENPSVPAAAIISSVVGAVLDASRSMV
jgi:hypothetical protein